MASTASTTSTTSTEPGAGAAVAVSRTARATAWIYLGFGVLVLAGGIAQMVVLEAGPKPNGCKGMVQEVMAIFTLAASVVVGVPHVVAPLWFLRRPARGRRIFLGLIVLNALLDGVFVVMLGLQGEALGSALWGFLFAVNVAAGWILVVRGRRAAPAG